MPPETPGIVHQSIGWETFKEYESKPLGAAARAVGAQQNVLTTIEFALSPFVPFSKDFTMAYGDLPGNGFAMHASSGPLSQDWLDVITAAGGDAQMVLDVANAPSAEAEEEAAQISKMLTQLLQQENIASTYDTTVKEELETQALATYVNDTYPQKWRTMKPAAQISRIAYDDLIRMGKGGAGKNKNTFDVLATSEAGSKVVEQTLNMLHEKSDPEFTEGVRAIETTMMTNDKYFQKVLKDNMVDEISLAENLQAAADAAVKEAMQAWDMVGRSLDASFKDVIKVGAKHPSGPENLEYFSAQLISRLMEFQNAAFSGGEIGTAFVFQVPLDKYTAGYVRIEPFFNSNGTLRDVGVTTRVRGGPDFQSLVTGPNALTVDIGGEQIPIFYAEGANDVFSGHRNMLVYHMYTSGITNPMELFQMIYGAPLQATINDLALKSHRGNMMGSAVRTMLEVGVGNTILNSAVVGAVEVIAARDAADSLQEQVTGYFEDPGMKNALTNFYKAAMSGSGELTNQWRDSLQTGNRQGLQLLQGGPYADASTTAPFTSEQNLEGIGMPWSLSIGRDPAGFEKFKGRETHPSAAKFTTQGIQQKRVSQYSSPLSVIDSTAKKPEGVRVDPEVFDKSRAFGTQPNQYEAGREITFNPKKQYITRTDFSTTAKDALGEKIGFSDSSGIERAEVLELGEYYDLEQQFNTSRMGSM